MSPRLSASVKKSPPALEKHIERVLNLVTKPRATRIRKFRKRRRLTSLEVSPLTFAADVPSLETAPSPADDIRSIVATDNVVGMGISEKVSDGKATGVIALTFYVERKKAKGKLRASERVPPAVPESIAGGASIVTDVKEIGKLRPEVNATRKPLQPGNSVGHIDATAGTFGAVVSRNGELYILSNSHVLALSGLARRGDAIVYPGVFDGGVLVDDLVAKLARFKKFVPGTAYVNRVDCAIARPTAERLSDLIAEIKGIGLPKQTIEPVRGMKVVKVGRTTGKTTGKIQDVHFRFTLDYGGSVGTVGFIDQVLCTRYTNEGDSGSLVIDKATGRAVGLHFAGADGGSVFSRISEVLKTLQVELVTKPIKKSLTVGKTKHSPKK